MCDEKKNGVSFGAARQRLFGRTAWMLAATLGLAACGDVVTSGDSARGGRLLDLIESLRVDEETGYRMVNDHAVRQQKTEVVDSIAAAPAGTTFVFVELTPMLQLPDGTLIHITEGSGTQSLSDGDLVLLPYDFEYADGTTFLSGRMTTRFQWDAGYNLFTQADPPVTFMLDGPVTGVTFTGQVFNEFLDSLYGEQYDNGEIAGATVILIDPASGAVTTAVTDEFGRYAIGPVPGERVWRLQIEAAGFYARNLDVEVPAAGEVSNLHSLGMVPSHVGRTSIVHGVVRDLDGEPVYNYPVETVRGDNGERLHGTVGVLTNWQGEYMIVNVPLSNDYTPVVRTQRNAVWVSEALVGIDPDNSPTLIRRDLEFPNHGPEILCYGDDGEPVVAAAVSMGMGSVRTLSTWHYDADGDALIFFWSTQAGSLTPNWNGTSVYTAPYEPGVYTVMVGAYDPFVKASAPCTFEVTVE